jgi:ABC-type transport system substrate-binding protein/DNA-binding beta-propeller fold protein YncE/predicted Ser/Thr protein kinase
MRPSRRLNRLLETARRYGTRNRLAPRLGCLSLSSQLATLVARLRAEVATGTVVAGFRVESLIGEGGVGAVYLAEEATTGNRVALKLLPRALARDERFRRRFLRESKLAASLEHPHVVPIVAAGEADGVLYLAMAHIEGPDLRDLLRREDRLDPDRALHVVEQVGEALDAAHRLGLVHRDVKPGNVLVADDPRGEHAYLCDFGLARHVSSASSLTGDRTFVGTIDYVPPEQIQGGPIDGRADVYSLGCVLFECLTGAPPFERESELAVVFAHLNEPPPRATDLRPELPEAFDAVFATALAKSPENRYPSCAELVAAARAASTGRVPRRTFRRRRAWVVAALGAAAATSVAGVLAWRAGQEGPAPRVLAIRPHALGLIDARTQQLGGQVDLRGAPHDVAFAGRSAWVLLAGDQRVARVDLETRKVTAAVSLPWAPGARLASGAGAVWVTEDFGPGVVGIDARTGRLANRFAVARPPGGEASGIAFGAGSVWLTRGAEVARVDPSNGRVLERIAISQPATRVVFASGAVWVASSGTGLVAKIDPVENRITATARLHGWISDLTVGGGFVWAAVVPDDVVYKLSEDDLSVQGSPASGPDPERISFGRGVLWIANTEAKTISLLDPGLDTRAELPVGAAPVMVRFRDGLVWTGVVPAPRPLAPIARDLELRVSLAKGFIDADLSNSRWWSNEQLAYATCANLLNYPDSDGPVGTRLRPEIAAGMPTLSRDGRTYTFRIRSGFRFSPPSRDRPAALRQPPNSVPETVTAETFRHTIERALSPKLGANAPAAPFASDIVGASAFRAGKALHIRGIVARGDSLSFRLVRPAGDFLTRISMHFFCPVPRSEPVVPSGLTGAIPSAGPYYMASYEGNRVVLLRNPNYAGDRPRRLERIVYTQDVATPKAVALADGGEVDFVPTDFDRYGPLHPGSALERRLGVGSPAARSGGQRYFLQPLPGVASIVFNTRRPLFRDVRLRRAVNHALDRPALAAAWGDAPADHSIPPAVPGYRSRHVYPTRGPELRTARRLAGDRPRRAVLYFCGDPANRTVAQIVRSNLAPIGIRVSIVESQDCVGGRDPKAERADLLLAGFGTAERDPGPFIGEALATAAYGSPLGPGPWNDADFRLRLERARALQGAARIRAYARLDQELTRDAVPFAVYASWQEPMYFGPRVGCMTFQSAYHFVDLGALCIRGP